MTFSKWFTCARCGFDYPVKYRRTQNGHEVCTFLPCYDEPGGQSSASSGSYRAISLPDGRDPDNG